jgi:hypothetical protein
MSLRRHGDAFAGLNLKQKSAEKFSSQHSCDKQKTDLQVAQDNDLTRRL